MHLIVLRGILILSFSTFIGSIGNGQSNPKIPIRISKMQVNILNGVAKTMSAPDCARIEPPSEKEIVCNDKDGNTIRIQQFLSVWGEHRTGAERGTHWVSNEVIVSFEEKTRPSPEKVEALFEELHALAKANFTPLYGEPQYPIEVNQSADFFQYVHMPSFWGVVMDAELKSNQLKVMHWSF